MAKHHHKLKKTLVEKMLDQKKITYESLQFELGPRHTPETQNHHIYKTLVLHGDKSGVLVGVIPVDEHLDERKLAAASGNKKVRMLPQKELAKTTGYVHGANTPIGIYEQSGYPIYLDTQATKMPQIAVSAGKLGRSVKLDPKDLIELVQAKVVDLVED